MLAKRYRDQPAVAAYDLWNEPRVPRKAETYRRLAQRLVDSIREVDGNHLIIIEKILLFYEEGGENSGDPDVAFVDIEDDNIAYDFHFYAPGAYTHQYMDYAGLGEGGKYPDPSRIETPQDRRWHSATSAAGHWGAGGTAWRYFEGDPVAVEDPDILAGVPAAKALTGAGAAEFAGIVVREFDATGQLVREIEAPAGGAQDGWTYWSRDGSGSHGTADGPQGGGALRMEGAGAIAVLARPLCTFEARQGHRYQAAGWVRAKDLPERGFAHVAVDWYESPSGLPVMRRDKESLAARLDRWLAWGAQHNRPVVIQELGANYHCFLDGKGGLTWYRDMLDLLEAREASYLFWCYHEEWWGFYRGTEPVTETTGREDLINLVRGALR
jgi:endoglucanase